MTPDWQLPHNGVFEFDFMYLLDAPDPAKAISDEKLAELVEWLRIKSEEENCDPGQLAFAFASISDSLVLRSD